jgi:hypothetical protein
MKSELLQEANGGRENQSSREGKRQRVVVDLLFALVIGT